MLNVTVILPVSVARCLLDLQLCSYDSLSFCYEHTYGVEVALQTLRVALHEMVMTDSDENVELCSRKEPCHLAAVGCVEAALREQLAQGPVSSL